jgi:hypothetical protein
MSASSCIIASSSCQRWKILRPLAFVSYPARGPLLAQRRNGDQGPSFVLMTAPRASAVSLNGLLGRVHRPIDTRLRAVRPVSEGPGKNEGQVVRQTRIRRIAAPCVRWGVLKVVRR